MAAIDGSLATLGLDYIDLMLIHSPQPWDDFRGGDYAEGNREAWRALEDAHQAGKLRAIGVSNFQQHDLENILGSVSLPKTTNPEHMRFNSEVDFEIREADMATLRDLRDVDYGEHSAFPVYSGK